MSNTTGYKVNGADLSTLFAPYTSGTKAAVTGYKLNGSDLNNKFAPYTTGTKVSTTGIKVNGNDMSNIFAPMVSNNIWSALGTSPNGTVKGIQTDSLGNIYVVGGFTTAGGSSINAIAKLTGDSTYSLVGSGAISTSGQLNCIAIDSDNNIYVGGTFTSIGGVSATNIAKWDGSAWSALGSGVNGACNDIKIDSTNKVYVGGAFTSAGGVSNTGYFAMWNGSWNALGTGLDATCNALAIDSSNRVYLAGAFTLCGGSTSWHIGSWDGTAYDTTSFTGGLRGTNNTGNALAINSSGILYIGGFNITSMGGVSTANIGSYNTNTNKWSALGSGLNGTCNVLALDTNNNLYAGGSFVTAGGVTCNRIAEWNGATWSALTTGVVQSGGNGVFALKTIGYNKVYVGGNFSSAGGVANTANLALWTP